MKIRDFLLVAISVVLSSIACMVCIKFFGYSESKPLRVPKVEIVDKSGAVRLIIGIQDSVNGTDQPELVMKDKGGREVMGLLLTPSGKGKMVFSTDNTEAKVALGFLSGSDVAGQTEEGGSWGMRIRGENGETRTVGDPITDDHSSRPK